MSACSPKLYEERQKRKEKVKEKKRKGKRKEQKLCVRKMTFKHGKMLKRIKIDNQKRKETMTFKKI